MHHNFAKEMEVWDTGTLSKFLDLIHSVNHENPMAFDPNCPMCQVRVAANDEMTKRIKKAESPHPAVLLTEYHTGD